MFVIALLKVIAVLRWGVGSTILAAAWLLKEDEEGRITNWLEDRRKVAAERHDQTLSKAAVYIQSLASLVRNVLTTVFGKKLLSIHAVFISCLLSLASLISVLTVLVIVLPEPVGQDPYGNDHIPWFMKYILLFAVILLLGVAIVCIRFSSSKITKAVERTLLAVVIVGYVWVFVLWLSRPHQMDDIVSYLSWMVGAVLSVSFDILFVATMRWTLQAIESVNNIRAIMSLLLVTTLTIVVVVGGSAGLVTYQRHVNAKIDAELGPFGIAPGGEFGFQDVFSDLATATAAAGASCAFDILLSCLIIVICLGISLNSLLWALIERNIYSFNRHKILMNKKLLWSAGIVICTEPHLWNLAVRAVKAGWF